MVSVSKSDSNQDSKTISGPPVEFVSNVMIAISPKQLPLQQQQILVTTNTINPIPPTGGEDLSSADLPPVEFDFTLPCRYFKSSFARSLSMSNSSSGGTTANQSKSMDFINVNKNGQQLSMLNRKCSTDNNCNNEGSGCNKKSEMPPSADVGATVPPIPARRQTIETSAIIPTASVLNASHLLRNSGCGSVTSNITNRVTTGNGNGNIMSGTCRQPHHLAATNGGNGGHFVRRNVCWPSAPASSTSSSGEQDCQLLDETDHETKSNGDYGENRFEIVDPSTNVEAVILQNQVDTLQWQLRQAETSCGMYRAVMEEVARFLERFQNNSIHSRSEQISRSKSMYHVYGGVHDKGSDSGNSSAYLRARSSTNLIDLKRTTSPSPCGGDSTKSSGDDHYDLASPINSYNTFKDFTWRRSPKKRGDTKLSPSDEAEDKLTKEAFRLSRTIHNLLHTQQPDLTQHRQSLGPRIKTIPNASAIPETAVHQKANLAAEMIFLRNMRDSRLSLRSSTDSSVHSTSSSSKVETDEENYSPPLLSKQCSNLCSTTEDESGFSSISSFHDIGIPLSSTMISSSASSSHLEDTSTIEQSDFNLDSRNSTLKAVMHTTSSAAPTNNVGVPVGNDVVNRWDSKTYRKNKFQRFSTLSNEDSTTVLWV